jgi:hypothetical protein
MIRKYNEVCKITTEKIKLARKEFEKELIIKSKRHTKILYNYVNRQNNSTSQIRALRSPNGLILNDSKEIVDLLNKKFQEVFVVENSKELLKMEKMDNGKFLDISGEDIKVDEVFDRLERLDVNKAMGPDNVHPHV